MCRVSLNPSIVPSPTRRFFRVRLLRSPFPYPSLSTSSPSRERIKSSSSLPTRSSFILHYSALLPGRRFVRSQRPFRLDSIEEKGENRVGTNRVERATFRDPCEYSGYLQSSLPLLPALERPSFHRRFVLLTHFNFAVNPFRACNNPVDQVRRTLSLPGIVRSLRCSQCRLRHPT